MNIEQVKAEYKKMETKELSALVMKIHILHKEAIPILQKELMSRNEYKTALKITDYLISIKYHIEETTLFDHIVEQRRKGVSEEMIHKKMLKEYTINESYLEIIKSRMKIRGRSNIIMGLVLILFPLAYAVFLIIEGL